MIRVNLYGGPGSGKSTAAHYLLWRFKSIGVTAEYAREWIKRLAYTGDVPPRRYIQPIALGEQLSEERAAIATGVQVVVTDSPILLQAVYAENPTDRRRAIEAAEDLDRDHPGIHVFLERGDRQFVQAGRWEDEEAARQKDEDILDLLSCRTTFNRFDVDSRDYDRLWTICSEARL